MAGGPGEDGVGGAGLTGLVLEGELVLTYAVLSMAAWSRMPTGIHAQARRAAARLAHEVSSTSCASLDPPDLYSPMTERSTW